MSEFLLCLAELFTTVEDRVQILGNHSSSVSEVQQDMNLNNNPEGELEAESATRPASPVVTQLPVTTSEVTTVTITEIPLPPGDAMDTTPRPSPPPPPTPGYRNPDYAPVDSGVRREDEVVEQQMFQWPHPTAPVMVPPDYQGTHCCRFTG